MTTQKTNFPEGWKEVELGEIFSFQDKTGRKAGQGQEKGKYKFFTSSSEQTKFIDSYDFDGEYLIFASGGQAAIHYCNEKFSASNDCFVVKVNSEISTKYVYYYLLSKIYLLEEGFKGAGLKHISKKYIEKIKIICPKNIETQKKIVAILEKAEKLKEKREQAIKLADEYLKSVFAEMFLKEKDKFEYNEIKEGILEIENRNPEKDFPEKYFNYVDISSIDNNYKRIIETKKFLGKEAPSRAKQLIKYKDVLLSTVRPNLNAVAMVPKELNNQICSTGFCILRADNKNFIPEYLFFITQTDFFINNLIQRCKGANYPAVSNNDIFNIKIPLPPLELQQKFASIVEKVEKMKEKQLESKKKIDEMFNSLMQKAFRGELVK